MEGLEDAREVRVSTPFGEPSDAFTVGTLAGVAVAFLPRHGRGHRILPSELNARANIYALKSLGAEFVISISACGSLKEHLRPRDIVVPDQLYDHTKGRVSTFFGNGLAVHVGMAEPFCPVLRRLAYQAGQETGAALHWNGTYLCIEGPQFSTKAESQLYRSWGMDVIGMTALPEAKLAREAELCYAVLACVTDYDVWHETAGEVTVAMVIANLLHTVETSKRIIRNLVKSLPATRTTCPCPHALKDAIITAPARIPPEMRERLHLLVGRYLDKTPLEAGG